MLGGPAKYLRCGGLPSSFYTVTSLLHIVSFSGSCPAPPTPPHLTFFFRLSMAACGFGASNLKIKSFNLCSVRPKSSTFKPLHGLGARKISQFDGLVFSHRPRDTIIGCRSSVSETQSNVSVEDNSKQIESTDAISPLIPSAREVESLLTELCDTTSIAEFELKLGGFRLYVSRDLAEREEPPAHAPVTALTVVETLASNDSASSPSLALMRSNSSSARVQTLLGKATDGGLTVLLSPKVGFFRRSQTIKGKRLPPPCKEKDSVKEGKVLCYIEQLNCAIPIETDVAGEVVQILKKDGDPVGYGDPLIVLLPSFPGIKKT